MKSFSGIRAALVGACIASLIGLFVGQSMAAEPSQPHPPARVTERAQSTPTTPPPGLPKALWPDNGIAQRKLEGGFNHDMFVENDNGTWRAMGAIGHARPCQEKLGQGEGFGFL